ncbi:MAG TPA: efflux RND transporter periplasmic adaptor subunit [Kofleriaceae bacterium]|nr:efflux RND transporter periplasmic adaptor subunit [Kofleriaceae bacterium]
MTANSEHSPPAKLPAATAGRAHRIPILTGAIAASCVAVALAQHYHRPEPEPAEGLPGFTSGSDWVKLTATAPQWSVLKIQKAAAGTPGWSDAIPARITFDETKTSRLGSPLAGRITAVTVERGQRVKAGSPLFTVASPSLADLRADLEKAQVQRASAKINLDRTQALVDSQSLPGKELVAARQQMSEAELAVTAAQQKLASLRVSASSDASFTVTAPRDGVVVEKNVAVGQEVDTSNGTLLAIADLSRVWVVADLFESDGNTVHAGDQAKVFVGDGTSASELSGALDGTVDQVSAVVDPERHTIPVRVALANPAGALRPNAHVQLRFLDPRPVKVELPAEAVLSDGATSYVYVQDGGLIKRRTVTPGPMHQGKATVIAGLEPDTPVVTRGAILLDNQIQLDN